MKIIALLLGFASISSGATYFLLNKNTDGVGSIEKAVAANSSIFETDGSGNLVLTPKSTYLTPTGDGSGLTGYATGLGASFAVTLAGGEGENFGHVTSAGFGGGIVWKPYFNNPIASNDEANYFDNSGFHGDGSNLTGVADLLTNNTYNAGAKQKFVSSATTAGLSVDGSLTANPSTTAAGDVWFRSDTGKLYYAAGAASTKPLVTESDSATLTYKNLTDPTNTFPTFAGSQISGGTFGAVNGSAITALNGANISSGNIAAARIATALTTPGPIGGGTPGTGAFTSLTTSSTMTANGQPAYGAMAANDVMTKTLADAAYDSMNTIRSVQVGSLTWGGVTENVGLLPCFTSRPYLNFTFSWGTSPPRGHFLPYYLTAQKTITSATIKIISGTHATYVLRGAIYASDANGFPAGRLGSAWTWSCASTGMVTATVGSIVCPKGLIWVCVQPSEGNTAWGGNLTILGQANTNNALLSNILGTRVSGWDTYMHGIQPEAYGMSSLGSDASTMGLRSFVSANDYFPTVLLE